MEFEKPEEGEWVQPVENGYLLKCCGCGLIHAVDFRVYEGRAQFRMFLCEPEYKQYRRKQIAELADWLPGFPMDGVSVSDVDRANGSPRAGDKIARNPANHNDRWLVAEEYFKANFEPIE